jgi:hypothetical protein
LGQFLAGCLKAILRCYTNALLKLMMVTSADPRGVVYMRLEKVSKDGLIAYFEPSSKSLSIYQVDWVVIEQALLYMTYDSSGNNMDTLNLGYDHLSYTYTHDKVGVAQFVWCSAKKNFACLAMWEKTVFFPPPTTK